MLKTAQEVVDDFYDSISDSPLGREIHGKVLNGGTSLESDEEIRKPDAATEDLIVRWHGGTDSLMQTGEIMLHVYLQDITTSAGATVEDMERANHLMRLIERWIWEDSSEYTIKTVDTPHLVRAKGIGQHILVARLQFYRAAN